MHNREEWVLIQIGSQQKRMEWQVRPVFPDYLSVSYGCALRLSNGSELGVEVYWLSF